MTLFFCGHRGVGKTRLLKRLEESFRQTLFLDLDDEIEKRTGLSIPEIFKQHGEVYFRQQEQETLSECLKLNQPKVISLGAGFPLSHLPSSSPVLFVRRGTDGQGRIFLNRPSLRPEVSPLAESLALFREREPQFWKRADFTYEMIEGIEFSKHLLKLELEYFSFLFAYLGFESLPNSENDSRWSQLKDKIVTLEPELFSRPHRLGFLTFLTERLHLKLEIRDDLLDEEKIQIILSDIGPHRLIYSLRSQADRLERVLLLDEKITLDWALELGEPPKSLFQRKAVILSCHANEAKENFKRLLKEQREGVILKSSPLFADFHHLNLEITQGEKMDLLPRSEKGRWSWLRGLLSVRQNLTYVKFWQGSASDQVTLFSQAAFACDSAQWAAVLGDPVSHSYSPAYHYDFFFERGCRMWPVKVSDSEFSQALPLLKKLGLRWAAVTSPLKEVLQNSLANKDEVTKELKSANTMVFDNVYNTDLIGFNHLVEDVKSLDSVALWGGGGTLSMMQKVLPQARSFAVRKREKEDENFQPEVLIWAAPRKEPLHWPPVEWQPRLVIDLNYSENSMGLEFAKRCRCEYRSGLSMFKAQAEEQQKIWRTPHGS